MSTGQSHAKIKLREVNRHLVCRLCRGYYVDATTIAECLHSFCRSCIIRYLEKNSFCPICEVQINRTKPHLSLRLDKALQDVVYKVVPGLYHNEMRRRREFYANFQEHIPFATPEQCGLEERIIFSPEDSISLSIEYLESDECDSETVSSKSSESGDNPEGLSFPQQLGLIKLKNGEGKTSRRESQDVQEPSPYPKRYLRCPAVVNIGHLKKFIKSKHGLTDKVQVNVMHKRVPLPDHYTLMDVAYIYTWKRSAPLRFFYQILKTRRQKLRVASLVEGKESSEERVAAEGEKDEAEKKRREEVKCSPEGEEVVKKSGAEVGERGAVSGGPVAGGGAEKCEVAGETGREAETETETERREGAVEVRGECGGKANAGGVKEEEKVSGGKSEEEGGGGGEEERERKGEETKGECDEARKGRGEEEKRGSPAGGEKKPEKVEEKEGGVKDEKEERESEKERLLLNPISGQLESVPSSESVKPSVNGEKGSGEREGEVVGKGQSQKKEEEGQESGKELVKRSSVSLLKSFRKEKTLKDDKLEIKGSRGSSLTITAVTRSERPVEKKPAKFTVEIKAENKESEYDFDGSTPGKIVPLQEFSKLSKQPRGGSDQGDSRASTELKEPKSNWMSLQDFRAKMLKENNSNETEQRSNKKKLVPSLYKINSDKSRAAMRKSPNGKLGADKWKGGKMPRTLITIDTETETKKAEIKMQVIREDTDSPPKAIRIESKDGEYSVRHEGVERKENVEMRQGEEGNKSNGGSVSITLKSDCHVSNGLSKEAGSETGRGDSPRAEPIKAEAMGAIDLSISESSPKGEGPEDSTEAGRRSGSGGKNEDKMMEALILAAQRQGMEPLLKIPQCSLTAKNSQGSPGKNISQSEIAQASQFLEELRSDMKILETKNQLNPNLVLEHFAQKYSNLQPYQELYLQKIDLIRRLKRYQQNSSQEPETPQRKLPKLSPPPDTKRKLSPTEPKPKASASEDPTHFKSSIDKTLSQIQLLELHSRMLAAQNYKSLPAFMRYCPRSPSFCSGSTSPSESSGQQKTKSSSHSPNSSKSPPRGVGSPNRNSAVPSPEGSYFNPPPYLPGPGLNSEMTYHQMFQSYLNQQEQMNQTKAPPMSKKPLKFSEVSAKFLSEKYYVPQAGKKPEANTPAPVPPAQKT